MGTRCSYAAFAVGGFFILLFMYSDQEVHSSVRIIDRKPR